MCCPRAVSPHLCWTLECCHLPHEVLHPLSMLLARSYISHDAAAVMLASRWWHLTPLCAFYAAVCSAGKGAARVPTSCRVASLKRCWWLSWETPGRRKWPTLSMTPLQPPQLARSAASFWLISQISFLTGAMTHFPCIA